MTNKKTLAQHFTPPHIVQMMSDLCKNEGRFLEPACGDGILVDHLYDDYHQSDFVAIELDPTVSPKYATVMDFFDYPTNEKFSTVISNPPYLSYKAIPESTRNSDMFKKLQAYLGGLANLYAYFITKSYLHLEDNGEMVFIVPEEIFRSSSNFKLMNFLHNNGSFTDIIYFKKSPFLPEVSQPVLIFRYQKGDMSHLTNVKTYDPNKL